MILRDRLKVAEFVNADVILALNRPLARSWLQGPYRVSMADVSGYRRRQSAAPCATRRHRDRILIATGSPSRIDVLRENAWRAFEATAGNISRIKEVLVADRPLSDDEFARVWADVEGMNHAMDVAFARVTRRHRLLNQPLVFGENGKVVHVDPHTVEMPAGVTEEEMGPVFDYR